MAAVINSLVANVEATLTFTLASKLVDMMLVLQKGGGGASSSSSSGGGATTAAWILGAVCLMVLSVTSESSSSDSSGATKDMVAMLNQTLVLAFSRIVLLQIRVSTATASSPLFEYVRRFLEITFIVVFLYAVVKVIPQMAASSSRGGAAAAADAGSVASRQLSTLMINMQRTFAGTHLDDLSFKLLLNIYATLLCTSCAPPGLSLGRIEDELLLS